MLASPLTTVSKRNYCPVRAKIAQDWRNLLSAEMSQEMSDLILKFYLPGSKERPTRQGDKFTATVSRLSTKCESLNVSQPTLYRLIMLDAPNLLSTFRRLGRLSKEFVPVRVPLIRFVTSLILWRGVISPTLNLKLEDHPLSFVFGCLHNIFTATLGCWRPSRHLQPEGAPCCGDKGIHLTWPYNIL
jgi:hypothetical protein